MDVTPPSDWISDWRPYLTDLTTATFDDEPFRRVQAYRAMSTPSRHSPSLALSLADILGDSPAEAYFGQLGHMPQLEADTLQRHHRKPDRLVIDEAGPDDRFCGDRRLGKLQQ